MSKKNYVRKIAKFFNFPYFLNDLDARKSQHMVLIVPFYLLAYIQIYNE